MIRYSVFLFKGYFTIKGLLLASSIYTNTYEEVVGCLYLEILAEIVNDSLMPVLV